MHVEIVCFHYENDKFPEINAYINEMCAQFVSHFPRSTPHLSAEKRSVFRLYYLKKIF